MKLMDILKKENIGKHYKWKNRFGNIVEGYIIDLDNIPILVYNEEGLEQVVDFTQRDILTLEFEEVKRPLKFSELENIYINNTSITVRYRGTIYSHTSFVELLSKLVHSSGLSSNEIKNVILNGDWYLG